MRHTYGFAGAAGVVWLLVDVACLLGQATGSAIDRQRAVEVGLLPEEAIAGRPVPTYRILDRMEQFDVPGVSIAVINDGVIDWARGYGVKRAGGRDSVTVTTIFQAASLSKPVAAVAILRLADRGLLDLDVDVNDYLESWRVTPNEHTVEHPVTLRGLLSHTAGTTVSGFPGYRSDERVPTAVGVLDGSGKTDPVEVASVPGTRFRYSGGGYTIAQVLVEEVTGEAFHTVMAREVLDPVGMAASTYRQPLPGPLADAAAVGHDPHGEPNRGGWRTYPQQAAAGLWTTPTDIARFLLGVRAAYRGATDSVLEPATARAMLSKHLDRWGLGVNVAGAGDSLRISHGGANVGYRAFFVLYPVTGDGLAVMTNSDGGAAVGMDVVRAVSEVYGWPDYKPEMRSVFQAYVLPTAAVLFGLAVVTLAIRWKWIRRRSRA